MAILCFVRDKLFPSIVLLLKVLYLLGAPFEVFIFFRSKVHMRMYQSCNLLSRFFVFSLVGLIWSFKLPTIFILVKYSMRVYIMVWSTLTIDRTIFENVLVNITYLFIPKSKKQRKEEEEVSSLSIKLQMLSLLTLAAHP